MLNTETSLTAHTRRQEILRVRVSGEDPVLFVVGEDLLQQ